MVDKLIEAFGTVKRDNFLPSSVKDEADFDVPLPIGFNQTNSQPTTVIQMLQWLDPQPGDKILDIGSGSGWTTALLAHLVGHKGSVYAVEKIPELLSFGAENCRRIGINNVHFFQAKTDYGLTEFAPYDRILVSAAADDMPRELLNQLKVKGRLVIPVISSIFVVDKNSEQDYTSIEHQGFIFVPLA